MTHTLWHHLKKAYFAIAIPDLSYAMNIFKTELPKKDGKTDFSNCHSILTDLNLKDLSSEYHFEE